MIYRNYEELIEKAKGAAKKGRLVLAAANDRVSVEAAMRAAKEGFVEPVLVGKKDIILEVLDELGVSVPSRDIYDVPDDETACALATELIRQGKGDILMKGKVDTSVFLKKIVDNEKGLKSSPLLSIVTLFGFPRYHKLLSVVDGGMVPYPDLEQKRRIIENTVDIFRKIGYKKPKVGVLACVEKVNPKMPETVEARQLQEMNRQGIIKDCIVEGPISYDCAMVREIADHKGFESEIAGDVDILIAPNIHAGNLLGKALSISAGGQIAGIVSGAKCPIMLSSRGATAEEKYLSIVLAMAAATGIKP